MTVKKKTKVYVYYKRKRDIRYYIKPDFRMRKRNLHIRLNMRPRTSDAVKKEKQRARAKRFRDQQVGIGDQKERWDFLKATTGLSSDRDVAKILIDKCTESTDVKSGVKRQPQPVFHQRRQLRNVITQTRRKNVSNQGTQSLLKQGDLEVVRRLFDLSEMNTNQIKSENQNSDDVTEDIRWKSLKASLGCLTNREMSKILLDWFVNTNPLMKLSEEGHSEGETQATNLALSNMVRSTPSYHLVLRVSEDQERAIRAMCMLKGWPFNPSQSIDDEVVDFTRKPSPKNKILTPRKNRRPYTEPSVNRTTIPTKVSKPCQPNKVLPKNSGPIKEIDVSIPMDYQPMPVSYAPETVSGPLLLTSCVKHQDGSQPDNATSVIIYPVTMTTCSVTSGEESLPVVVKMEVPD